MSTHARISRNKSSIQGIAPGRVHPRWGDRFRSWRPTRILTALIAPVVVLSIVIVGNVGRVAAQEEPPPPAEAYARMSKGQLQRLVAPIALYPDSLIAQVLAASTFPSQLVDANEWVKSHQGLNATDLAAQANDQPWDNSVKALVQFPSVLANLVSNIGWTSELGDAYYNQPADVMKAVQVMRKKAQRAGNLDSTPQENIYDQNGQVVIDPAQPNVVYVPTYNPWAAYGYPIAPWPGWVDVPGIWWGGPGISFGIGFPISPYVGFGWGWNSWGMDWYHQQMFFNREPYFARGPAFFDRGGYYGGNPGFYRQDRFRPFMPQQNFYRGFDGPRGVQGMRSGPFSGFDHGGVTRGFSARGQSSFGGFHGGGFRGGGFHGGGGGFHGGGGRR
jgi:uncharacterized membrane protein YgcG